VEGTIILQLRVVVVMVVVVRIDFGLDRTSALLAAELTALGIAAFWHQGKNGEVAPQA